MEINEYIKTISSDGIPITPDLLHPYLFSMLGLTEEVTELEETFVENRFDTEHIKEEAGDVLFYCFQFANRIGNGFVDEFMETYNIDEAFKQIHILLKDRTDFARVEHEREFYKILQAVGKLNGVVKKAIRKGDAELKEKTTRQKIGGYLSEIVFNVLLFLHHQTLNAEMILDKCVEKWRIRLERYKKEADIFSETTKAKKKKKEETANLNTPNS